MTEEKEKRSQFRTRVGMNFDPRTTKLHSQKDVREYLAKYGVCLSPEIEMEFFSEGTDFTLPSPNDDVYMHPQIMALGLKLPLTPFVRGVLAHYRVAPSQLSVVAWRTVLGFEALCALECTGGLPA